MTDPIMDISPKGLLAKVLGQGVALGLITAIDLRVAITAMAAAPDDKSRDAIMEAWWGEIGRRNQEAIRLSGLLPNPSNMV